MPRLVLLIVLFLAFLGVLYFLSTQAREVPTSRIETDVVQGNAG